MKAGVEAERARAGVGLTAYFLRGVAFVLLAQAIATATIFERGPNVVLIVVDTLRADRLSASVGNRPLMPVLQALARESIVYDDATAPAPMTMPSVAALMTGSYPDRAGVVSHSRRTSLAEASAPLAELARAAGYSTAAVVSNPWLASRATRFHRGFDRYLTKRELGTGEQRLEARAVTDAAIGLLETKRRPLFLWVHYLDTHMPYRPPAEDAQLLQQASGSSAIVRDYVSRPADRQTIYFEAPYPPAEIEATRKLYDACAHAVDREIGRLLDAVDRTLGRDDTLLIVTADHGESLGEHGLYFAHDFTLYRELTHVPLLLRVAGAAATRVSTPVSLVDVVPTLCARTPLACPPGLDGVALPTRDGVERPGHVISVGPPYRERYARNPFIRVRGLQGRWSALRDRNTTLVRIPTESGIRWQAFDLSADPGETRNLFDARRDTERMRALERWLVEQSDVRASASMKSDRWRRDEIEELRALGYLD